MRLAAICTGQSEPIKAKSGRTGHFKVPQAGAVNVTPKGAEGDVIVDTAHHGGPDQAIYLLGEADRLWWQSTLNTPLPAGFMGENMLIDALDSADLALGDQLEVGTVTLQITAPRVPCVTFAARIGDPGGVKRFLASGHPGAYARVLRSGAVSAFDPVRHMPFDGDRISVVDHLRRYAQKDMDAAYLRRLLTIPAHYGMHELARHHLGEDAERD